MMCPANVWIARIEFTDIGTDILVAAVSEDKLYDTLAEEIPSWTCDDDLLEEFQSNQGVSNQFAVSQYFEFHPKYEMEVQEVTLHGCEG